MAIVEIPISFEYEGIEFTGSFSAHSGALNYWDLNLNGYSYGILAKYSTGWQWCSNGKAPMFLEDYMEQFFVSVVEQYLHALK
jgi:hypothetical protein